MKTEIEILDNGEAWDVEHVSREQVIEASGKAFGAGTKARAALEVAMAGLLVAGIIVGVTAGLSSLAAYFARI